MPARVAFCRSCRVAVGIFPEVEAAAVVALAAHLRVAHHEQPSADRTATLRRFDIEAAHPRRSRPLLRGRV
jgi:hypothetical protein